MVNLVIWLFVVFGVVDLAGLVFSEGGVRGMFGLYKPEFWCILLIWFCLIVGLMLDLFIVLILF